MEAVESVLSSLPFFEHLRVDEVGVAAQRFERFELAVGEDRGFPADIAGARFLVVVRGRVEVAVESPVGEARTVLHAGDRHGELALLTGRPRATFVRALRPSLVAALSRTGLDAILDTHPAVALPLACELASELNARNDIVRQLIELHAEGLPPEQLRAEVERRRRELGRRGVRVGRMSPAALFRRLVIAEGGEPPFWMLLGTMVSLAGARLVVAFILHFGLEKRLFALVPGSGPNPMHVHHFNYGLILVGAAGLAALFPFGRRALRLLAFTFGVGCGLVIDEFALFWNLNPEYAQPSSLIAAAILAVLLVQLTYFRRFWRALFRRGWLVVRGAR